VLGQLQLLLFSGLAFFVMLPYLRRTLTITLDVDWLWRRLLPGIWARLRRLWAALGSSMRLQFGGSVRRVPGLAERALGERGRLARTWSTRGMAVWVLLLLLGYLALYYV
jgi:multicomponent Na+:H+ antiporter subunit D